MLLITRRSMLAAGLGSLLAGDGAVGTGLFRPSLLAARNADGSIVPYATWSFSDIATGAPVVALDADGRSVGSTVRADETGRFGIVRLPSSRRFRAVLHDRQGRVLGDVLQARVSTTPQVRVADFGAQGDGKFDDTHAIQRCLSSAPEGAEVLFEPGRIYRVDPNYKPVAGGYGGIKPRTGQVLLLQGAELRALPSRGAESSVVTVHRVNGVTIAGPGTISGERSSQSRNAGEFGHGISFWSSMDWLVAGLEVTDCQGDGIYVGYAQGLSGTYCEHWHIEGCTVHHTRRNGVSIVAGRQGTIVGNTIRDVEGAAPQGGIDLEPDDARYPNRSVRVLANRVRSVEVGIYVVVGNRGVLIRNNDIYGRNAGVMIGDNASGLVVEDNRLQSGGGREGAAIRTAAVNHASIEGVSVTANDLIDGHHYVLDLPVEGYRRFSVRGNRIRSASPGTRVARMIGGGIFQNNRVEISGRGGVDGDFFVHFVEVETGRNEYRNLTGKKMYSALVGSAPRGRDSYLSPSLRHGSPTGGSGVQ